MAALYLYAITDRPEAPLPSMPGLEDAPLCALACQDLAGVISSVTTTRVQATESNLWQHEAIVEALMADRAVLPVRFGAVFSNEAAARAELLTQQADLIASLNRVRGRVELGLRVLRPPPCAAPQEQPPDDTLQRQAPLAALRGPATNDKRETVPRSQSAPASRGRAYLMARLEQEQRARVERQQAEACAAEVHAPLARLAVASVQQVSATPRLLLTAAYLVERDRVEAFRQEVAALGAAHPALSLLCTGPWPPYNFVDLRAQRAQVESRG